MGDKMNKIDNISRDIKDKYSELFSTSHIFREEYLVRRRKLYIQIFNIMQELHITSFLDIGCAYGLLVEYANSRGINGVGLDLHIDELVQFHNNLSHSKGKFIYGSAEDEKLIENIAQRFELIILLDTLRYLKICEHLNKLNASWVIVKEVCNNFYIRWKRKDQFDIRLYSPVECLKIFSNYSIYRVYPSKANFYLNNPNSLLLKTINLTFPNYTIILKKRI